MERIKIYIKQKAFIKNSCITQKIYYLSICSFFQFFQCACTNFVCVNGNLNFSHAFLKPETHANFRRCVYYFFFFVFLYKNSKLAASFSSFPFKTDFYYVYFYAICWQFEFCGAASIDIFSSKQKINPKKI